MQTTSKNSQRHYRTKRLIDLSSNTPNCYLHAGEFRRYLMRVRRMRGGTELEREIQLTYWSTGGEQGKVVFVISAKHHGGIYFPFHNGKNRLSIVPITHQLKFFTLRFLSRKNLGKELVLTNKSFFVTSIQFQACASRENLSKRSCKYQQLKKSISVLFQEKNPYRTIFENGV